MAAKNMISFSEKQRIAKECQKWLEKSGAKSTPFNIITFLSIRGYLKETNSYKNKEEVQ